MKRFQMFRSDGDEGGEPIVSVDLDESGNPVVVEEIEPEEPVVQRPKFGVDDFESFLEENPEIAARFQPVVQNKTEREPTSGIDFTKFVDGDGLLDVHGLGQEMQALLAQHEEKAFQRGVQAVQQQYGPTIDAIAAEGFADRVCREHELGEAGRARIIAELEGMSADAIRKLPVRAKNLLVSAGRDSDRVQNLDRDTAAPGGKTRAVSYTLAIPDPTGMGWAGYCRQMDWDPKDPAAIKRGRERGILK